MFVKKDYGKRRSESRSDRRRLRLREAVFSGGGYVPVSALEARERLEESGVDSVACVSRDEGAPVVSDLEDYGPPDAAPEYGEPDVDDNDAYLAGGEAADQSAEAEHDEEAGNENHGLPAATAKPRSVDDVSVFFASMQARREVPISVMSDILAYVRENQEFMNEDLPSFRQMRYKAMQTVPTVLHDVKCLRSDGTTASFFDLKSFPKKLICQQQLRVEYVLYHTSLKEVVRLHEEVHPHGPDAEDFDLSLDGVPESKSSGLSIDILSLSFRSCRTVYTIAVLQPSRKAMQLPDSIILKNFLSQYESSGLRIRYVIADAPKRAPLQGLKQHSATFGCPYCKASKIRKRFPSNTAECERRSDAELRALGEQAEAGENDEEVLMGVKQQSPLRHLGIDLVHHVPAEQMHLIDLGIVRKILQLSYKCAAFKATDVPFVRSNDTVLTSKLLEILVLPQFARRTRPVDFANYKAEEFRNLATCFWPAVADTVPQPVRDLWLLTIYIVRAVILPDDLFAAVDEYYDMRTVLKRWYVMFEAVFTERHCSYNVHVFGAHLMEIRALGPLTDLSAYRYESHYNIMKKSYRAGTPSTGQQAMRNSLLATKYSHTCEKRRQVTGKRTSKTDDTYCYLLSGKIVRITSDVTGGSFLATLVKVQPAFYALPGFDFNKVLAFKMDSQQNPHEDPEAYRVSDVVGKCVAVGDVLSVMPWNLLNDT